MERVGVISPGPALKDQTHLKLSFPRPALKIGYKPHGFVPKEGNQWVFKVGQNNIKLLNSSTIILGLPTARPSLPDSLSLFLQVEEDRGEALHAAPHPQRQRAKPALSPCQTSQMGACAHPAALQPPSRGAEMEPRSPLRAAAEGASAGHIRFDRAMKTPLRGEGPSWLMSRQLCQRNTRTGRCSRTGRCLGAHCSLPLQHHRREERCVTAGTSSWEQDPSL